MTEVLNILPISFWATFLMLLAGGFFALGRIKEGIGLPILAVLGTTAAWYVGDVFYNDYTNHHVTLFNSDILDNAWWQVALFVLAFLIITPLLHRQINANLLSRTSQVFRLMQNGASNPLFQLELNRLFWGIAIAWAVLVGVAFIQLGDQIQYYFFPFLGYRANPWGRGRIGAGCDFLLSFAGYFQLFFAAMFGLVAALARNRRVRLLALAACCFAWPNYIFDRTRNTLLAVVLPGILAWVFVRLRGGWFVKLSVLAICFSVINVWLAFIIANRSQTSVAVAFNGEGVSLTEAGRETHHAGLNMFEELCWINKFIASGDYKINWGLRYLAELANPVPRTLWPGKPMIGIDYAAVRGQSTQGGDDTDASGVNATISTGMIGQGVVNFGWIFGPIFTGLLMALWVVVLARLDLRGDEIGKIPLYALGMIFTFNLGRDITIMTLYPFLFGFALVWLLGRRVQSGQKVGKSNAEGISRTPWTAES